MTIGCIIQARMGSTRLPGKVLMDIEGKTVLQRVLERVSQIRGLDNIIVATYNSETIQHHVQELGYYCYNSWDNYYSEDDVLARYRRATEFWEWCDTIVRITADCPLLDPEIAERVIQNFKRGGYDYYSNCRPASTFPDGTDVEVFTYKALERAHINSRGREREHVTPYIYNHRYEFKVGRLISPVDLSMYRMTLDTEDDLRYIRRVYRDLGNGPFGIDKVLALPYCKPHTLTTNNK